MKFLKHFRSKSKLKDKKEKNNYDYQDSRHHGSTAPWVPTGMDYTKRFNDKILTLIFQYVCPHTTDDSYDSSERSMIGDGCMLCDLRDLSNCSLVKKSWYPVASGLL
jgi:hypothetical protein